MKTGEAIVVLVSGTAWVCGMALAKGFWMTLAAVIPPVAWVLLAEHVLGVAV
ncbi:hypothetical protein IFR35_23625 [Pseudomonas fluorescens]|jgi:uncharacterized membrane protein|uniref:hypothetical protein n=1 Tax=Pseudomonas fluorescens TaxID=294 RepID=UPI00178074B1|nr:hypothetical protein [Pseudomonas fluorescens]MBD8194390.1 hypothetical protein [Pseudomonas fluorescens]MBD8229175.1 hypothetical protein [Pseudomonas fluorescens]MBD8787200.1 hypothetical protein [Pseudomonas fluorescens]MBD8819552.1 hypothetical protein [Pseudomonas fluorescens]